MREERTSNSHPPLPNRVSTEARTKCRHQRTAAPPAAEAARLEAAAATAERVARLAALAVEMAVGSEAEPAATGESTAAE